MNTIQVLSYSLVFSSLFLSCDEPRETVKPILGKMTQAVYASVTILPEDLYNVYSANPGMLSNLTIKEGDQVSKGQSIAQIKSEIPELNIDNAKLQVDLAQEQFEGAASNLNSIRLQIIDATKQLQLDSTNYSRQSHLWSQNIGSKLDLDSRKIKFELSQNKLKLLQQNLNQVQIELQNNLERSKINLKQVQNNFSEFTIQSEITGKVYELFKENGEFVSVQEPIAQIGNDTSFTIEMIIDEVDITNIQPAQTAVISLDAYPEEIFNAIITKIHPLKDTRTQTFLVEGRFTKAPKVLYAGLSGEANILISETSQTLTIPLEYLLNINTVLTDKGEIKIKTGYKNISRIEVISGIDTSTVLIKP